jgi:hypothetical protein
MRRLCCLNWRKQVAKTRLQLQGELVKGGGIKVYNNAFDAMIKTWRNEGIRGMQRGLGVAVCQSSNFQLTSLTRVLCSMRIRQADNHINNVQYLLSKFRSH